MPMDRPCVLDCNRVGENRSVAIYLQVIPKPDGHKCGRPAKSGSDHNGAQHIAVRIAGGVDP